MKADLKFKLLSKNQEKLIVSLARKRKRTQYGLCICEGLRACRELYDFRPELIQFGILHETLNVSEIDYFKGVEFYTLSDARFNRLTSTVNPQGIILVAKIPLYSDKNSIATPFIFVLDKLADPGNFGTIMRTALSVGLDEIWYSAGTVDPFSEKTIRSALGAQFKLKLREFDNLKDQIQIFKKSGYNTVFRTEPAGGESCFEAKGLFDKSVIVFGNEASGVENIEGSLPLHIPMPGGFESINVAQAVTVILFEAVRRKIL